MTAPTLDQWLRTHAAHQPGKTALRFEGQSWTYAALDDWVTRLAGGLSRSLKRGQRIACLGHNTPHQIALFFAAARLGLMVVPMNWRLSPGELGYVLDNADAALLVYGPDCAEVAHQIAAGTPAMAESDLPLADHTPPQGASTDPFLIVYTSGTTGRPKGAVLTQEAVFWNALNALHAQDLTPEDHILNVLPLFHVGGINIQVMPTFFTGGTVTLHRGFDPGRALSALEDEGITTTVCVPTMMRALMSLPDWDTARLPKMRLLTTGSTDVPVDILKAVNARGLPMVQVYGATETGPIATYQRGPEAAATLGSIGRAAAHAQVRLSRPDGSVCDVEEPGELWLKGPNLFDAYWKNPTATAEAFQDGWFKTGDVARQDANGLYWFVSRLKHVIISGGENIYPAEIERILASLPGLREAAVVGRPDERWGEVPVVVAVGESALRGDILSACAAQLARYKQPKDVIFVDALPRNALGKVVIEDVRALAYNQSEPAQ